MGITGVKEKVRDGYLCDIPENLQKKVFGASRLIIDTLNGHIDEEHYEDLTKSRWAMSCLDEFKTAPTLKGEVGSVRVYKAGKNYKCMIQITGHFTNHQYGWIEELLHEIIAHTYQDVRPEVRKKFDVTLANESSKGSPHEGFDIFLKPKDAQVVWDLFEGRKTKLIKESSAMADPAFLPMSSDDIDIVEQNVRKIEADVKLLLEPIFNKYSAYGLSISPVLRDDIEYNLHTEGGREGLTVDNGVPDIELKLTVTGYDTYDFSTVLIENHPDEVERLKNAGYDTDDRHNWEDIQWTENICGYDKCLESIMDDITSVITDKFPFIDTLEFQGDNDSGPIYSGPIDPAHLCNGLNTSAVLESVSDSLLEYYTFYRNNMSYDQYFDESSHGKLKKMTLDGEAKSAFENMISNCRNTVSLDELNDDDTSDSKDIKKSSIKESADNNPEYNVDMTETQAKRTLRTLSQGIMNDMKTKTNYKITQYTANIYANIITKNLLQAWGSSYKKLSITLDSYQSFFTFEFKIPTMSQDFVSRFINGREPMNAFLHRVPEIKIKMSPRIFHTMQNPDDAYNFFKAAVKYYDQKVERYSKQLMNEAFKLNHSIKHLISTTNLSGIVTYPIQLLFVFDDVHMNNAKTFILTDDDIKAVNSFMKGIYTKYAAPEKEKKRIVDDIKTLVKELRESCDDSDNMTALKYLPEAVEQYLFGGYDAEIDACNHTFMNEQVDMFDMQNPASAEVKYMREKFGVKKLKKIPTDLVAYISIETEAIETPNDKLMIASYCLSKIEIVEWYIELLEVGSKKYVVPHSLPYLQRTRTQLLECYNNIMAVKVSSSKNKPIIDIQYPKGYEG